MAMAMVKSMVKVMARNTVMVMAMVTKQTAKRNNSFFRGFHCHLFYFLIFVYGFLCGDAERNMRESIFIGYLLAFYKSDYGY